MQYIKLAPNCELLTDADMTLQAEVTNTDGSKVMYVPQGAQTAKYLLRQAFFYKKKVIIYYDPDIDGLIAGTLASVVADHFGLTYEYRINSMRQHGFCMTDEELESIRGSLIIAVDFLMTEEELQRVVDAGVDIISIDHHLNTVQSAKEVIHKTSNSSYPAYLSEHSRNALNTADEKHLRLIQKHSQNTPNPIDDGLTVDVLRNEVIQRAEQASLCSYAVLINNQYPFEPAELRFLSGAGMVYETFKFVMPSLMQHQKYKAMVGWTLISDSCNLDSGLARGFLNELYNWNDSLAHYLIELTKPDTDWDSWMGSYELDNSYIVYTVNPKFNAMFRANMGDYCVNLMLEMLKAETFTHMYYQSTRFMEYRKVMQKAVDYQKKVIAYYKELYKRVSESKETQDFYADTSRIFANKPAIIYKEFSNLAVLRYILPKDTDNPTASINRTFALYSNYIGVAINQILPLVNKTVILLLYYMDKSTGAIECCRGSMRGFMSGVPYMSYGRRLNLQFIGHEGACGLLDVPFDYKFNALNSAFLNAEYNYRKEYEAMMKSHLAILDVEALQNRTGKAKDIPVDLSEIAYHNSYVEDKNSILLDVSQADIQVYSCCKMAKELAGTELYEEFQPHIEEAKSCRGAKYCPYLTTVQKSCACKCWTYNIKELKLNAKSFSYEISPYTHYIKPYLSRSHVCLSTSSISLKNTFLEEMNNTEN